MLEMPHEKRGVEYIIHHPSFNWDDMGGEGPNDRLVGFEGRKFDGFDSGSLVPWFPGSLWMEEPE